MTDEQLYLFDLKGWIVLPALLAQPQIDAVKAHLYAGSMGLSVYPLIGGNLTALHAAMARADAFFAESVVLAATLTADGFNLDMEIGTQAITPKDTSEYLTFLDAWAVALEAAGLELQYDLGGCDDPYKSDFMCAPPAQPCSSLLRTADWAFTPTCLCLTSNSCQPL
jgi:hypothetical protein